MLCSRGWYGGFVPIYGAVRRPTRFYIAPDGHAVARFSSALVMSYYLALGLPPKYRPTRLFMHAFMRLWHGVVSHPRVIDTRVYRTHRVFSPRRLFVITIGLGGYT